MYQILPPVRLVGLWTSLHALTCFSAMDFSADMPSISTLALTAAAALCSW
jgi:hypothetical protein